MADPARSLANANCPICNFSNPSSNPYCGQCGSRVDSGATVLEAQIQSALKRQLKDREVVEIETTQAILTRLTDWAKLFAFFAAIPLALLLGTLAIWGVTKFADVNEKLRKAQATAQDLQSHASTVSNRYEQLEKDATKYEGLHDKYEALTREVQSVKTDVSQISKRIGFVPSPALTPDLQKRLELSLAQFEKYLIQLGYHPNPGKVVVSVVETLNGDADAEFSPAERRMTVTVAYASQSSNVLKEYMNVVLNDKSHAWESFGSYHGVRIGLSDYIPSSFLNKQINNRAVSAWPKEVSNTEEINNAGFALANILWEIRQHIDPLSLDTAAFKAWSESQTSIDSKHFEKVFAAKLIRNLGSNGVEAKKILAQRGIE